MIQSYSHSLGAVKKENLDMSRASSTMENAHVGASKVQNITFNKRVLNQALNLLHINRLLEVSYIVLYLIAFSMLCVSSF